MKVYFWGTQGSLPASLSAETIRNKIYAAFLAARGEDVSTPEEIDRFINTKLPFAIANTYGCATSCIEIRNDTEEFIFCDAGSGIRDFADHYIKAGGGKKTGTFHIIMTHLHWDHVMGFPFFTPAYIPGNRIIVHGYHKDIEDALRHQMNPPCFPVSFDQLGADIEFDIMEPCQPFDIGGIQITSIKQNHPGESYGFRFSANEKSLVHSTDSEHKEDAFDDNYRFISFFQDADLLIFDAMYSLADATFTKADWGHSSNVMGVELAARSHARKLCLFHHEPTASDGELDEFLFNSKMYSDIYKSEHQSEHGGTQYPEDIILAYDGLELEV